MGKKFIKEFAIDFKTVRSEKDARVPEVYSLAERKKIMLRLSEICKENKKAIGVMLSLSLGLRIGEVCALKWKNFDFKNKTVFIDGTVQRIARENLNAKTQVVLGSPKSFSSRRIIPVPDEISGILASARKSYLIEDFVISGSVLPVEPRSLRYFFKSFCQKNGFRQLKFHSLRHSFATCCIENKADCKTVSEILGHSNIKTTMNLYVHPSMETKRRCINMTKFF